MTFQHLKLPISQLNLKAVLKCGQSFRWSRVLLSTSDQEVLGLSGVEGANSCLPLEEWRLTLEDRIICLRQTENALFYKAHFPKQLSQKPASETPDSTFLWLRDYFQLDVDLEALYAEWCDKDPVFKNLASRFIGIRILRQDPWENLVSFICSQNNHISRITSMVHALCTHFSPPVCSCSELPGSPSGIAWHPFPPPKALADPSVETKLRELGFGYRAKYIQKTAAMLCAKYGDPMKTLLELRQLSTTDARARLLEFYGVGPKVADCILLMSLDKTEVVPVDTHVQQIATKMYGFKSRASQSKTMNPRLYSEIATKFTDTWGPYAGWAHSVLFTADLKSFANFGLEPSTPSNANNTTFPSPLPAHLSDKDTLINEIASPGSSPRPQAPAPQKRKTTVTNATTINDDREDIHVEESSLAERVKRRRRLSNRAWISF